MIANFDDLNIELAIINGGLYSDLLKQYDSEAVARDSLKTHKITLTYGNNHKVDRVISIYSNENTQKEIVKKDFYPKHFDGKKWINGLGDRTQWQLYHEDLLPKAKSKWILWHEGEKACDYAINKGFISTCIAGSLAKDINHIEEKINYLKAIGISGIAYICDYDDAGKEKGKILKEVADKLDFPCLIIPIENIDICLGKGDDIVEYLEHKKDKPLDIIQFLLESHFNEYYDDYSSVENIKLSEIESKSSTVTSSTDKNDNNNHKDKKRVAKTDAIDEVREILTNEYSTRLKYNELKRIVELDGEEAYLDDFYIQIHEDYGIRISKQIAYDLTVHFAKKNSYHPVKDYLNNLQENSQEIDIKNLSSLFFGTTNKLYDEMVYRHLIGSVARVFKQGCKLDTALILQGKQGIGKSTFFNVLYGNEFFTDSVTGTDRDNLLILHQHWCSELAEFESITGKKASGELKAFLSKSVDTFREPYGRSSRTVKRQSVIVGSVNECEFLVDSTGNRRFWVIPIDQPINLEAVKKYRDVIWYLAKKAFLEGENWYLNYKYQKESEDLNKQYLHTDSWDSLELDNYLTGFEEIGITVRDILIKHLGFEENQIKRGDEMRMSKILISKSWFKKQQFIKGKKMNKWFSANFEKKVGMVGMVGITVDNKDFEHLPTSYQPQKVGMDQKNENLVKYTNLPTSNNGYTNLNEEVGSSETLINKETYQPTNLYQPFSQTTSNFANLIQNDEINLPTNLEQNLEKNDSEKNQSNLNNKQKNEDKNNIADTYQESNKQEIDFKFMVQIINSYLESYGLITKNDKHSFIESQIKRSYKNLNDLTDKEILDLYTLAIV